MKRLARLLAFAVLSWSAGVIPALAQETTPAMLDAAAKEGKVVWYTSVDVKVAEAIAKAFKADYPKIDVDVERRGPSACSSASTRSTSPASTTSMS